MKVRDMDFARISEIFMESFPNTQTILGEELDPKKHGLKRSDLQTAELAFAQKADFTILLLESPGAIAELATFSMMENIRPRLFVMVPDRFYNSESYIARGPLSVLAKAHLNNVIYFDEKRQEEAIHALQMPIALFKYAKLTDSFFAMFTANSADRPAEYLRALAKAKLRFLEFSVLVGINMLETPTFPMIVGLTRLNPQDTNETIGRLIRKEAIQREGNIWRATKGFFDPLMAEANSTYLSVLKANFLAAA
ncbi:hypothetical protein [Afipia sp. Root123D2]|uniref:hypothetical protein n=1 Tax=Afipia sp. Root123D2 TaxID=1736436 RepID=UPI0007001237|nr:hypothetical protein [Afipia sp. Root123D2]